MQEPIKNRCERCGTKMVVCKTVKVYDDHPDYRARQQTQRTQIVCVGCFKKRTKQRTMRIKKPVGC